MKSSEAPNPRTEKNLLVRIAPETADTLEDLQYARRKAVRRRVTKRELVEEALLRLAAAESASI